MGLLILQNSVLQECLCTETINDLELLSFEGLKSSNILQVIDNKYEYSIVEFLYNLTKV
jgi:hypothetical protein